MYAVQEASGTALTIEATRHAETRGVHRSNLRLIVVVAVVWILLDQLTKIWAEQALPGQPPVSVVGELLQLRLVYNSGAAFSLGTGNTWVFTILATVVITVLLWTARTVGQRGWAVALALLIGGAGGNLVDRLARDPGFGRGHVVDFLALPNFPVFNVADIGITAAACSIAYLALRGVPIEGSPSRADNSAVEDQ